jgi:hypothetical protein
MPGQTESKISQIYSTKKNYNNSSVQMLNTLMKLPYT